MTSASAPLLDRARVPVPGPPPPVVFPRVHRSTLGSGVPVVVVERRDLPVVAMEVQLRGGPARSAGRPAGLAALTADLLDEGAGGRSALDLAADLDRLGATLSTTAGYDAAQIELVVLRPRLEEALDRVADVLRRPAFAPAEIARVRDERITALVRDRDEPRTLARDAFARVLYGEGHPWGRPLGGSVETLGGLGRADVVDFWESWYRPELATVIVAGDVGAGEARDLLEARLGDWTGMGAPPDPLPVPAPPSVEGSLVHLVDRPGAPQSEIRVGRVAVSRSTPDYFPLTVLNTVLGGSFTSRLNARLREEKGYTYGAGSGFAMRTAPGPFAASAAVHTPATADAVRDVLAEIRRLGDELVPEPELERAKRWVALRLPQRFETTGDVAARLSEVALHGLPDDHWDRYVGRVMAVTAADVRSAARRHLDPDRMAVVIAGDRAEIEGPLGALGLAVSVLPGPEPPARSRT